MSKQLPVNELLISKRMIESKEPYDIIYCNIHVINQFIEKHFKFEEMCSEAVLSYYVDYFLQQVNNGGFSQYVYNCNWRQREVESAREGLRRMGAARHLALFEEGAQLVEGLGPATLEEYLEGNYHETPVTVKLLNGINDEFFAINKEDDLVGLNRKWLLGLPNLRVLEGKAFVAAIAEWAALIPDKEARVQAALDAEPGYLKALRKLCEVAGHVYESVNALDHAEIDGKNHEVLHLSTDQGHHRMIADETHWKLLAGEANEVLATLPKDVEV